MAQEITEGKAIINIPEDNILSKKASVFYNPVMKLNRDLSITAIKAYYDLNLYNKNNNDDNKSSNEDEDNKDNNCNDELSNKSLLIADPLAGSGVRAIRFFKELPSNIIKKIYVNDLKQDFKEVFLNNAKSSSIKEEELSNFIITSKDANMFLLENKNFDYIDIDPFGSPNPFLDSAIKKIRFNGLLAVTATDTAPLCGTYPRACLRKYWAKPLHNHLMHEVGLRILIRKCQLIGAQFEKALIPLFSYSKDHYFRVFFIVKKGKKKVDEIILKHDFYEGAGPMWLGSLSNNYFVEEMIKQTKDEKIKDFLSLILSETRINNIGFIDLHTIAKELKMSGPLSNEEAIKFLRSKGVMVSKTHFLSTGLKVSISHEEAIDLFRKNKE